ncbi:hypothetical protein E2C01_026163 [Portunus trituberculatus]|uniref:Uncharacterized protein n=1 Tax=Portunus trituberculatus TaxID=210409 RepID=A0A5B7EFB6_PORTR|nr:hypothetical protein [Portunus trituberculatus]
MVKGHQRRLRPDPQSSGAPSTAHQPRPPHTGHHGGNEHRTRRGPSGVEKHPNTNAALYTWAAAAVVVVVMVVVVVRRGGG